MKTLSRQAYANQPNRPWVRLLQIATENYVRAAPYAKSALTFWMSRYSSFPVHSAHVISLLTLMESADPRFIHSRGLSPRQFRRIDGSRSFLLASRHVGVHVSWMAGYLFPIDDAWSECR